MRKEIIRCDHCGKELDIMKDFDDMTIELGYKWVECDLCDSCLEELYSKVYAFCNREEGEWE